MKMVGETTLVKSFENYEKTQKGCFLGIVWPLTESHDFRLADVEAVSVMRRFFSGGGLSGRGLIPGPDLEDFTSIRYEPEVIISSVRIKIISC